jgi:hypothetical protein
VHPGIVSQVGTVCIRSVGEWDGKSGKLTPSEKLEGLDVVVKLPDSYLGIGDLFLEHGKDFKTAADLEGILQQSYRGKEAFLLEWIRPRKDMEGVHQLDIITVRTPNGIEPLSVLYWGDCSGPSSHSCRAGYTVDFHTEKIIGPTKWYSYAFVNQATPRIGETLPGVKAAVQKACAAHQQVPFKWLKAAGWDCMLTDKRGAVFFEGNFAGARLPRRVFLDWPNLFALPKLLLSVPSS